MSPLSSASHLVLAMCVAMAPAVRLQQAPADQPQEVDAKAFLVAFRHNDAARYDGFRVTGTGGDFQGLNGVQIESNGAYAMTRVQLTVGRWEDDESITLMTDRDTHAAAERSSRAMDIVLKVPVVIPPGAARRYPPSMYRFSGVYLSQFETLTRVTVGSTPTLAPCRPLPHHTTLLRLPSPKEPAPTAQEKPTTTPYCVPVLVNASVR
jgi:hypothetical protein